MARYDVSVQREHTPPFVLWTLAQPCALKDTIDPFQSELAERLLRGVRCYSDAVAEQRAQLGIVLQRDWSSSNEPLGFAAEAVLAPVGSQEFIASKCRNCPANAMSNVEPGALAGCVGYLVPPEDRMDELYQRMHAYYLSYRLQAVAQVACDPLWYGVWLEQPMSREMLLLQNALWSAYITDEICPPLPIMGLEDFQAALNVALLSGIPLIAELYPPGVCEGRRWTLAAHCGRCIAPWPEAKRQQCRVCGQVGGRQPERIRRRMGTRPYRDLREFLSEEQITAIKTAATNPVR